MSTFIPEFQSFKNQLSKIHELDERENALNKREADLTQREFDLACHKLESTKTAPIRHPGQTQEPQQARNLSGAMLPHPAAQQSAEALYFAATGKHRPLFSKLSPAEIERLACILEECAEVQQIVGKILRHGYDSTHPDGGPTNRKLLEIELGDLVGVCHIAESNGDIDGQAVHLFALNKLRKIGKYLHHNTVIKKP